MFILTMEQVLHLLLVVRLVPLDPQVAEGSLGLQAGGSDPTPDIYLKCSGTISNNGVRSGIVISRISN